MPGYGEFERMNTEDVVGLVIEGLRGEGLLIESGAVTHRYPICWRCSTALVFRIVQDWFISADEIRGPMLARERDRRVDAELLQEAHGRMAAEHGRLEHLRKRYFGLPLPSTPAPVRETVNVIGIPSELRKRATGGLEQLRELHRPWIDEVVISCERCGARDLRRIPEVGDAWLDAGIVPFSTLGWQSAEYVPHGYSTGAARPLSGADLPDDAYWEKWFPADWISEMREQIRLWFYSQSFMSVTLVGRSPYERVLTYEKVLDETGREMHKSWGNAIEVNDALERMGADVMRWMYCVQPPNQPLKFGFGLANDIKRRLITLWNSVSFLVTYADIEGFRPGYDDLADPGRWEDAARPPDRWLVARTGQLVAEVTSETTATGRRAS